MLEWLLANAVGFVFREVLASVVKDALEDNVKDFFKDCIGGLVDLARKDSLKTAFGKAIKEFLELVQQELEDAGLDDDRIEHYTQPLKQFTGNSQVLSTLGQPFLQVFSGERLSLDTYSLANAWDTLRLLPLPDDFNWQQLGKRYSKKVKSILQESDELRERLQAAQVLAQDYHSSSLPYSDFRRYQESLKIAYSRLRLDCLALNGCHYSLQLWNIFVPQDLRDQSHPQQPMLSIQDLLHPEKYYQYTVILGNPGSGKSTLTQYKALAWARQSIRKIHSQEFPLLIELRNYAENLQHSPRLNFLDYFQNGKGVRGGTLNRDDLHEWLTTYPAIVMFDGLDEVLDPAERENIVFDIIDFSTKYPQVKILVTSRIVGYEAQRQRFADAGFRHFMLQDLNKTQILDFVTRWHHLAFQDDRTEGERKRQRLQNAIDNSLAFRELAGNPLLLTMMAIINRRDVLPRDRVTLYKDASAVLLQHWEANKYLPESENFDPELKELEYQDKQEMLRQIAWYIQGSASQLSGNLFIGRDDLQDVLGDCLKNLEVPNYKLVAKSLARQLTSRSFIVCFYGGDAYGFVHRTFLEFFCAWSWLWRFEKHAINEHNLKNDLFRYRWQDETWHEVLSLVASDIDRRFAAMIVEDLISQDGRQGDFLNLFLAVRCLSEQRSFVAIQEVYRNKLARELEELAEGRIAGMIALQEKARQAFDKFRSLGHNGNRG